MLKKNYEGSKVSNFLSLNDFLYIFHAFELIKSLIKSLLDFGKFRNFTKFIQLSGAVNLMVLSYGIRVFSF